MQPDGQLCLVTSALRMLVIILGAVSQFVAPAFSQAQPVAEADKDELAYSENDSLCRPLADLYAELQNTHVYADVDTGRRDLAWNWEDRYPEKFAAIGLRQPTPLRDAPHTYVPALSNINVRAENGSSVSTNQDSYAYYRVDLVGDGTLRVVHIEDFQLGGSDQFGTNVWILRPGTDIDAAASREQDDVGAEDRFSPSQLDLAIFFASTPARAVKYGLVKAPYFFDKILSNEERKLPLAKRFLTQPFVGTNSTIQRLFEFRRHYFFIARLGFTALVYRFTEARKIEDVCYVTMDQLAQPTSLRR